MQPGEGDALKKVKIEDSAGTSFEFIIKGGDKAIQEIPIGTNPLTPGGSRKYGDFDPSFGHIQMTSWERGWGGYDFSDDEYRFDHAINMWTATKNNMFPVPSWIASGDPQGTAISTLSIQQLNTFVISGQQTGWYATKFTTKNAFNATDVYIWVLFRGDYVSGSRPNAKAEIYSDSAGSPNASLGVSSVGYIQAEDERHWVCLHLTFGTPVTLGATTDYHMVIKLDASTDNSMGDFWLSAGESPYGTGLKSTNSGSSWSFADPSSFYLQGKAGTNVTTARFFELARTPFKLVQNLATANNQLFMCGDHGLATGGTGTTLVDTGMGVRGAWSTNQWSGDLLIIVAGTGVGQERIIASNNNTGTITVSDDWVTSPDTTSEYAIISYDDWYLVSAGTHGIGNCKSVCVARKIAYFAEGYGGTIRRMRFNGSALQFADDTGNDADILFNAGGLIWRGTDDDGLIGYAPYVAWGTNLTFTNLSQETDTGFNFTGANLHGGNIYIFKEDSVWFLDPSAKILYPFPVDFSYFASSNCGSFSVPAEEYLYISWGANMQRISGLGAENVDVNRDKGLPSDYRGKIAGLANHPGGIVFAVNGGNDNVSSVNIYDNVGFHNAFTSEMPKVQIHDIAWHVTETQAPRLLISLGEVTIVQTWPKDHTNPLTTGISRVTQGMLETSTIDMGGKVLPKFFKDIVAFVENANYVPPSVYGEFVIFYQADGGDWTYLTTVNNVSRGESEKSFADPTLATINALSNIRELKLRFYAISGARCYAVTLKGFSRTPIKSVYSFPIDISPVTERLGSGVPSTMLDQFWTWAMSAEALYMTSQHERLHQKSVIIIPRSIRTQYIDRSAESFAVDFYLELREV